MEQPESDFQTHDFWSDPVRVGGLSVALSQKLQQALSLMLEHLFNSQGFTQSVSMDWFSVMQRHTQRVMNNPATWMQAQQNYWVKALEGAQRIWEQPYADPPCKDDQANGQDKRFASNWWRDSLMFRTLQEQYRFTTDLMAEEVAVQVNDLPADEQARIVFITRQICDALCPSNFPMTNPDVIAKTLETQGQNLLDGVERMIADIKAGYQFPLIRQIEDEAFTLGVDLATTPGQVVYRNDVMELIHYTPTQPCVGAQPIVLLPPWINKYYIMDLRPENSFVGWMLGQGLDVYLVSWVNPDETHRDYDFDDYMQRGVLAALSAVEKTSHYQGGAHILGYCIAGTLLTMTLSWLQENGQEGRIASATFLTTLLDFNHAGDLKLFVTDTVLDNLASHVAQQGYLEGEAMKALFSLLRANDLIWPLIVRQYWLGQAPYPFDLLYWNSDSTNMPARLHMNYLRSCYVDNKIAKGSFSIADHHVDLTAIKTPCYFMATEDDHIAPWRAVHDGARLLKNSPVTFVIGGSGHVAGVINPPVKGKYHYKVGLHGEKVAGSWWPHWRDWVASQSNDIKRCSDDWLNDTAQGLDPAPGKYIFG